MPNFTPLSPREGGVEDGVLGTTVHELSHILGLQHAVNSDSTNDDGRPLGWCGAEAEQGTPNFPYVSSRIEIPDEWNGFTALGPDDQGLAREVWGVNTEKGEVIASSPYRSDQLGGPNSELMSYCRRFGIQWASDTTYTTLRKKINSRFSVGKKPMLANRTGSATAQVSSIRATSQQEENYLLVKGRIYPEGDSLTFRPFTTTTTTPALANAVAPDSGGYTLQALDGSGDVIEDVSFEPSVAVAKRMSRVGSFTMPING